MGAHTPDDTSHCLIRPGSRYDDISHKKCDTIRASASIIKKALFIYNEFFMIIRLTSFNHKIAEGVATIRENIRTERSNVKIEEEISIKINFRNFDFLFLSFPYPLSLI
jgi:hypothetical protein